MNKLFFVLSIVGQLGFIIAIPAAILGFAGAYLDRTIGTSPLFILLGLALAVVSSGIMVYRLTKKIQ